MIVHHEIGLKFMAFIGRKTFGITTRLVELHVLSRCPIVKNSWVASVTSGFISLRHVLKNPLMCPSLPGDFSLGIENIASFIFLLVTAVQSMSCYSRYRTGPWL